MAQEPSVWTDFLVKPQCPLKNLIEETIPLFLNPAQIALEVLRPATKDL
jgi:hypothetical protein